MKIQEAVDSYKRTMSDPNMMRVEPEPITDLHPPAPEGPQRSPMIRCPMPFVNSSSDNTRTFYTNSIPLFRIIPRGQ